MNLLILLLTIVVSFIVVRIGAIAFQLTGLPWSLSKFQALSCFTGTGFTTREAELITGNPQRRSIASFLMVLGNAGFVTLIATAANSLNPNTLLSQIQLPFLHKSIPPYAAVWIKIGIIGLVFLVTYRFFNTSRLGDILTDILRRRILKREMVKRVSFEELVVATGGYGVSKIDVCGNSPILGKALRNSELRDHDISVLAIEREGIITPNPPADTKILFGDKLICFGKTGDIRKTLCEPA
ncbi:MAG: TrkA C-terminal domain-containing protein [Candidatus Omnitrophota bacterium]